MIGNFTRKQQDLLSIMTVVLLMFAAGCITNKKAKPGNLERPRITPPVAWRGSLPSGSFRTHVPERITITHTGVPLVPSADPLGYMKNQQERDLRRGWGDLGAHYYVGPSGAIFQSRDTYIKGRTLEETDAKFDPQGHILITLIGDYNEQALSEEFQEGFVDLTAWLIQQHNIPMAQLKGINEYTETDGPGRHFTEWIKGVEFEVLLKQRLGIPLEEELLLQLEELKAKAKPTPKPRKDSPNQIWH